MLYPNKTVYRKMTMYSLVWIEQSGLANTFFGFGSQQYCYKAVVLFISEVI